MSNGLFGQFASNYYATPADQPFVSIAVQRHTSSECDVDRLESNPLWYHTDATARGIIQVVGSFILVLVSELIMAEYDVDTAPMQSAVGVALPYFIALAICPRYNFNPLLTLVGGLIPMTPCSIAPEPETNVKTDNNPSDVDPKGAALLWAYTWRVAFDVTSQLIGGALAAIVVWRGMSLPGTDIIARFDTQLRSDIASDPNGAIKVFWYVYIFSCVFAFMYHGIRYGDDKVTCVSVQRTLNPVRVGIICATYLVLVTCLAPIIGVGSINVLTTVGAALATLVIPQHFAMVVCGQLLGFTTMSLIFRYIVHGRLHTCGCLVQKRQ